MIEEFRDRLNDELILECSKLKEEVRALREAALNICNKYVSGDFYRHARAEIDKVYEVKDND